MDYEQIEQENQLWPWLADESMADETYSDWEESPVDDQEWNEWCPLCDRPLGECPDECHEL